MKTTKNKTWYDNVNGISEKDFRVIQRKLTDLNYDGAEIDDNDASKVSEVSKSVTKCTKENTDSSVKNPRIIE